MKKFHIGLDFGTYQTKACIYDFENKTNEFFKFTSSKKYFLPSTISETIKGTFKYGESINQSSTKRHFHYFKIAAADDPEFRAVTSNSSYDIEQLPYDIDQFKPYTPEFLSSVFLAYTILIIKEAYTDKVKVIRNTPKKGFLAKLAQRNTAIEKEEEVKFTIQLGIPTEWSRINNLRRKRKFENILLIAELLTERFKTSKNFTKTNVADLISEVQLIYQKSIFSSIKSFEQELNERGLSVYPETAAGLSFITKSKQIKPGYYAIMDIGGGSTDISFFHYEKKNEIKYLASESYEMAANNVYSHLSKKSKDLIDVKSIELEVHKRIKQKAQNNDELFYAIKKVKIALEKLIQKLFAKRVYWFDKRSMRNNYKNQLLIVYGGGINLNGIIHNPLELYNNGNLTSLNIDTTNMEVVSIDRYQPKSNVLPIDLSWQKDFQMLVVALGLSYIHHGKEANWIDKNDYHASDGDLLDRPVAIAHPFNEDCYVYNVIKSEFHS